MRPISKLQYITTSAALAEQACKGGIDWIQLRLKNVSYDAYFATGKEVQAVCKKYNATFIINDFPKLALALNADGVHVGKDDPSPQEDIEALQERDSIIGCTVNCIEDFIHLSGKAVSYIGFGPFRFTSTKEKLSPVLGIEGYKKMLNEIKARELILPPVLGIGGITIDDVPGLMAAGLYGIAVSGAISNADDITQRSKEFKRVINNYYSLPQKEII